MGRKNNILIKFSIILISLLLIEGGKTFIPAEINIHFILARSLDGDVELPDHDSFNKLADNEIWMDSTNQESVTIVPATLNIPFSLIFKTTDFKKSIWQPPKSV